MGPTGWQPGVKSIPHAWYQGAPSPDPPPRCPSSILPGTRCSGWRNGRGTTGREVDRSGWEREQARGEQGVHPEVINLTLDPLSQTTCPFLLRMAQPRPPSAGASEQDRGQVHGRVPLLVKAGFGQREIVLLTSPFNSIGGTVHFPHRARVSGCSMIVRARPLLGSGFRGKGFLEEPRRCHSIAPTRD